MALRVNTNVVALAAQRNLGVSSAGLERSLRRLSSGLRITSAADDAAGLSIANKLRAQLSGLKVASLNAAQGSSLAQVAEGAGSEISNILVRLRELAVSAASDQNDASARSALDAERIELENEVDRISKQTTFSGVKLVDGSFGVTMNSFGASVASGVAADSGLVSVETSGVQASETFTLSAATGSPGSASTITMEGPDGLTKVASFTAPTSGTLDVVFSEFGVTLVIDSNYDASYIGADDAAHELGSSASSPQNFHVGAFADESISLTLGDLTKSSSGLNFTGDVLTQSKANSYITTIDSAIGLVNTVLGDIGAFRNRMDFASSNLAAAVENVSAAESTIRDADIAAETTEFTKNQILVQAGVAILAQANIASQSALALLQ